MTGRVCSPHHVSSRRARAPSSVSVNTGQAWAGGHSSCSLLPWTRGVEAAGGALTGFGTGAFQVADRGASEGSGRREEGLFKSPQYAFSSGHHNISCQLVKVKHKCPRVISWLPVALAGEDTLTDIFKQWRKALMRSPQVLCISCKSVPHGDSSV